MKNSKKEASANSKIDAKEHAKLLDDVLSLTKKSQLKKPTRTEPTLQISEFNLVKSVRGKEGAIRVSDLTKVLKKRAKHVEISKKVQSAGQKAKTLPKPLEKPKAQRIRRAAAFENVKKQLSRWDAVVTSNRASNHLSFPMQTDVNLESGKNFSGFRVKTELQKKLEELQPKVEVFNLEKESEYPLTMQEMLERRKEMAKLRAIQSYKEAKARRQNKIKSKKFHRVQRHEKIKKQMKEFEQLQKTNPEEALKKLEEIEQVRAEERASLRHRSTGKWAQSKQVRAKYDKDSRQVLAQQLQISRELTQKMKASQDSESEDEAEIDAVTPKSDPANPWTNPIKTSAEVESFLTGYRKFWETNNKAIADQNRNNEVNDKKVENNFSSVEENESQNVDETKQFVENNKNSELSEIKKREIEKLDKSSSETAEKTKKDVNKLEKSNKKSDDSEIILTKKNTNKIKINQTKQIKVLPENANKQMNALNPNHIKSRKLKPMKPRKTSKAFIATTNWEVSILSDDSETDVSDDIDTMFEKFGDRIQKQLKHKQKKLKAELQAQVQKKTGKQQLHKMLKTKPKKKNNKIDLSFPQTSTKPVIDEEMSEVAGALTDTGNNPGLVLLDSVLKSSSSLNEDATDAKTTTVTTNIDPENIIKTKPVNLDTDIPDLLTLDENEENADQRGTISEAFADDDVLEEFKKDKQSEIEKGKPQDVNLALPGWGSWGGTGIKPSKRKNKRFIIKFPKELKRRDDNKGNLIINEKADTKLKPHLVSDVPFPFKSVKDFEASIRTPIGNTFVPETAFRKMIRPAVKTKMGTIIEPMTDDILLKKKK